MNKKLAEELLKEFAEQYPNIEKVQVDYEGSGDSFNDFWNYDFTYKDKDIIDENQESEVSDRIMKIFDNPIWECIENAGADFNNDGSRGTVTIDFKNLNISADNYAYIRRTEEFNGEHSFFDKE